MCGIATQECLAAGITDQQVATVTEAPAPKIRESLWVKEVIPQKRTPEKKDDSEADCNDDDCVTPNPILKKVEMAIPKTKVKIKLKTEGIPQKDKNENDIKIKILLYDGDAKLKDCPEIIATMTACGCAISDNEIDILDDWLDKNLKIKVEKVQNIRGDKVDLEEYDGAELKVCSVEIVELRLKLVDVRSNEKIANARVSKLKIIVGKVTIEKDFHRTVGDSAKISENDKVKASIEALKRFDVNKDTVEKTAKNTAVTNKYDKSAPPSAYDDAWRKKYNDYWTSRASGLVSELKSGNPTNNMMSLIIDEYNNHYCTDGDGILRIQIPKALLDKNEVKIEVGFFNFPIALERIAGDSRTNTVLRNNENAGLTDGTGFKITWNGTQSTDWDAGFGWVVNTRTETSELKVSEKITAKNDTDDFTDFNPDILSTFYNPESAEEQNHFTLFALQWCQPVWDGIADSGSQVQTAVGSQTYIQDSNLINLNMHIVTTYFDIGGTDLYGGKGYGKAESRNGSACLWRSGGHRGIDLHAALGDNVFAIHNGSLNRSTSTKGGNILTLTWTGSMAANIGYLHLNSYLNVANNYAMTGQIIAYAGRTGNLGQVSEWPGHVHLNLGVQPIHVIGLRNTLSQLHVNNLNVIPCNEYPLLFPCSCAVTSNGMNPANCNFNNTTFVNPCWAVFELRCPHMIGVNVRNRRIQAQLRQLGYYTGTIDGIWGILPTNASSLSKTRRGIYNFKAANNLLLMIPGKAFNPANYDMNEEIDDMVLDQITPIHVG